MKDLFLSYELTLILKGKGFNEPCFAHYSEDGRRVSYTSTPLTNKNSIWINTDIRPAPTYQQVIDWLEINYFADCYSIPFLSTSPKRYESYLLYRGETYCYGLYDSRTEAIKKSIEEALKLI